MSESTPPEKKIVGTNVLGQPLEVCGMDPVTGYYRNGCCQTGPGDVGLHVVCAVMTEEFLAFSKARGNDLSTPRPEMGFAGVLPGDQWCLCVTRWMEAHEAEVAPGVALKATHLSALEFVPLDVLRKYAVDDL